MHYTNEIQKKKKEKQLTELVEFGSVLAHQFHQIRRNTYTCYDRLEKFQILVLTTN